LLGIELLESAVALLKQATRLEANHDCYGMAARGAATRNSGAERQPCLHRAIPARQDWTTVKKETAMRARLQKLPPEPRAEPRIQPVGDPRPHETELRRMIAEAAYYRAEKRGLAPGLETDDWCEAEREVLARVRELESRI
jgi:hypothetical protein